jgi:3-isopropylmalate dehydrogenase
MATSGASNAVIAKPEWRTADLGGPLGTKAFAERVGMALGQSRAG